MADFRVLAGPVQPQGPGEDPLLHYTKLFVKFLQLVFGTFEKGSYKWTGDPQTTDIVISHDLSFGGEVVERTPCIVVTRGPFAFGNVAMDQFKALDEKTGRRSHTDLVSASVTYQCMSKESLEAQRLAWISMMATRRLKRNLMRAGLHRVGEEIQVSPSQSADGLIGTDTDAELVTVSVPFYFQDSWTIEPVDKILLKDLELALTLKANSPVVATIQGPSMNGTALQVEKTESLTERVKGRGPLPRPR